MQTKCRVQSAAWWCGAWGAGLGALCAFGLALTPLPEGLGRPPVQSVEIRDRNGVSLRRLLVDESRHVTVCRLEEVSPHLVAATLSAEDRRFWWHPGVDPLAVVRAVWRTFFAGKPQSGASTLTQQLVKGTHTGPRSLGTKLWETWIAVRVEFSWSKKRILSEYLNRLDYGNLQVGIASASRHYFAKPPSDLSPAESAFLAALPRAPGRLNPRRNPEGARTRQLWVLDRMRARGCLDADAWERALREPMRIVELDREYRAPCFVNRLLMRTGLIPAEGGVVHSTLDVALDQKVEEFLGASLAQLNVPGVAGAVVVVENATGNVLAMAGVHTDTRADAPRVDGAWAVRSPGSAMKPFTYALALENGLHPGSVVADVPSAFATPTGLYRPNNYNHHFHGPVSLRFALGNSLNVAAVRVLEASGGASALHRMMLQLGVTSFAHGPEYYGLGLTLGNGEVRLLEMVNAYATIARLGEFLPYRFLANDREIHGAPSRVLKRETAYLLADMLSDNGARAATFGLNSQLRFDFPVACKTGTSSDYRDNWTVGFTPEFTVGVWVGRPDGESMAGVSGVSGAAPVFHAVMEHLHATFGTTWYLAPETVRSFRIDPFTGRAAPPELGRAVVEKCASPPGPALEEDYDSDGRVQLSEEYRQWLEGHMNPFGEELVLREAAETLRVLEPLEGTVFFWDPDLPRANQTLALSASGAGKAPLQWECDSAPVVWRGGQPRLELREGIHVVRVREPGSNRTAQARVEVRPL